MSGEVLKYIFIFTFYLATSSLSLFASEFNPMLSTMRYLTGYTEATERLKNLNSYTTKKRYVEKKLGYQVEEVGLFAMDNPEIFDELFGTILSSPHVIDRGFKSIILKDWGFLARQIGDFYRTRYDKYNKTIHINVNTHNTASKVEAFFQEIDKTLPLEMRYRYLAVTEKRTVGELEKNLHQDYSIPIRLPNNKEEAIFIYHTLKGNLVSEIEATNVTYINFCKIDEPESWIKLCKGGVSAIPNGRFLEVPFQIGDDVETIKKFLTLNH